MLNKAAKKKKVKKTHRSVYLGISLDGTLVEDFSVETSLEAAKFFDYFIELRIPLGRKNRKSIPLGIFTIPVED